MSLSSRTLCVGVAGVLFLTLAANYADDPKPKDETKKEDANKAARPKAPEGGLGDLALEVQALRLLKSLNFSAEQIDQLKKLAGQTAMAARPRKGKASPEYCQVLNDLHDALALDDDDAIDSLNEKLDKLNETEKPELDDAVEATDAAKKAVPAVVGAMKVTQFVAYLVLVSDQVIDPAGELKDRLDKVRGMPLSDWKDQRDEMVSGFGKLLAGVDQKKADAVREKILALLSQARTLKDEEYRQKRPELEKLIDAMVKEIGPSAIARHLVELAMADLLSNPRLAAALEARKPVPKEKGE